MILSVSYAVKLISQGLDVGRVVTSCTAQGCSVNQVRLDVGYVVTSWTAKGCSMNQVLVCVLSFVGPSMRMYKLSLWGFQLAGTD